MTFESDIRKSAEQVNDDRLIEILENIAVTIKLEAGRIDNLTGSLDIIIDRLKASKKLENINNDYRKSE